MSIEEHVVLDGVRRSDLIDLAQRGGWRLAEQSERRFESFATLTWLDPAGRRISMVEAHPFGFRMLATDDAALLGSLRDKLPTLGRDALLALAQSGPLERRAFALRALAVTEALEPSAELCDALASAAMHESRFFRQMIISLCRFRAVGAALEPTIRQRAVSDADLAEEWADLLRDGVATEPRA